jgi:fructosamine-3-kinase
MLLPAIKEYLTNWLLQYNNDCSFIDARYVTGGSINEAYRISTTCGVYFLKYNSASKYPQMFEKEKISLELLEKTKTVIVPKVFIAGSFGNCSFLLLKYEEAGKTVNDYWTIFAKQLSALHKQTSEYYGLDFDNYIGSLPQINTLKKEYNDFFIECRLIPLIRKAVDASLLEKSDIKHFENLFNRLREIIPHEKPSLLHGDLWSGNLITNNAGLPTVIDPAIYYGHREADIAMTRLFGGFPNEFFYAYNNENPLQKGWDERIPVHQLYPLLVHVNLFGLSYRSQVREIIKKF